MKIANIIFFTLFAILGIFSAVYVSQDWNTQKIFVPVQELQTTDSLPLPEFQDMGMTTTLGVGEKKEFSGGSLVFTSVEQDSRCPQDVQCIWAGEVAVVLLVSWGRESGTVSLKTNGAVVVLGSYRFALLDVSPAKITNKEIPQKNYRATIKIEKIL